MNLGPIDSKDVRIIPGNMSKGIPAKRTTVTEAMYENRSI